MAEKSRKMRKWYWLLADVIILLGCAAFLFPLLMGLLNSFKPLAKVLLEPLSLDPANFTLDAYFVAFRTMKYGTRFFNSLLITGGSLFFVILLSSMAAYKLSRDNSRLSGNLYRFVLAFILIPFQCTMIPLTVLMTRLNLINTFHGTIIGYIGFLSPMAIFLYHGYIKSVPTVLDESAQLDGCSAVGTFFKIIFPLIAPMTATIVVIQALSTWNDYLYPLIMLQSDAKKTLVIGLTSFSSTYMKQWDKLLAATVMVVIPVLVVYIAMQKYIIRGLVAGAVKS